MNRMVRIVLVLLAVTALALPVAAQQADNQSASNPLVQLLQSKGILSADEAANVRSASNTAEANERLARLLWSKGLISQAEYNTTVAAAAMAASNSSTNGAHMVNASASASPASGAAPTTLVTPEPSGKMAEWPVSVENIGYDPSDGTSADASVIPAIAPIRLLSINVPKDPKGIIPDVKLGSGAMMNIYGFIKASTIYDTSNSGGSVVGSNDFPLPLLLNTGNGDTGPDSGSQFRIKARSTRAGVNFFYPMNGPDITLTGKIEFDFEGDYTTVSNRNVSSIRNSQLTMRLAWARIDGKVGNVPYFFLFGQDWTPLATSTMFDLFETTQIGAYFGNPYERVPQFRTGLQFSAGSLKIQPEFAIVLPGFGDSGLNASTSSALFGSLGAISTGYQDQTRAGAVLGQASGQPGVEGRIVFDFPLDSNWKGVPNAELIVSGGHSEATEILPVGNIPTTPVSSLTVATDATPEGLPAGQTCATPSTPPSGGAAGFSIRCYYPTGATLNIPQNMFTAEWQLPTPFVTFVGKYYRGGDMRFMFGGQLDSAFRDLAGPGGTTITLPDASYLLECSAKGTVTAPCPNGAYTTVGVAQTIYSLSGDVMNFNAVAGSAVIDPYRPIRGQGGFAQLGFPLSRIFGANPEGQNSGWTMYMGYGVDSTYARDVIREGGNGLLRSDYVPFSLRYKINKYAQFVEELTWYDTRTADAVTELYRGLPAHVNHDIRQEFGTVFTF